jgi:hypothetical protein
MTALLQLSAQVSRARSRRHVIRLTVSPRLVIAVEVTAGDTRKTGLGKRLDRSPECSKGKIRPSDSIYLNKDSDLPFNQAGSHVAQRLMPDRNNTGIQ